MTRAQRYYQLLLQLSLLPHHDWRDKLAAFRAMHSTAAVTGHRLPARTPMDGGAGAYIISGATLTCDRCHFTNNLAAWGAAMVVEGGSSATVRDSIIAQIPTGRLGEPEEIARCVVFLASDDAGFINGSTISANGGQFFV